MADYTPTNDVFGRFIEGLKMGQQLQENKAKREQDLIEKAYKQQIAEIARRAEDANFDYISGGNIHSGAEYDLAKRIQAQPENFPITDERRTLEDIGISPMQQESPASTFNVAQGRTLPARVDTVPFNPNALGYTQYGDQSAAEQYMAQAGNLDRFKAGLEAMGKPVGLNVQTDPATGMQYIPGTKRGEKPIITSVPANPQLVTPTGGTTPVVVAQTGVGRNSFSAEQTNMVPLLNTQTGQATLTPKGTITFTPVGAAQMADTTTRLSALTQSLNEFETLLKEVPAGPIKGNIASVVNTFTGYFPEVRTAKGLGGVIKPLVTRILGGDVGNLAAAEQVPAERLTEALVTRTKEERAQAFKVLRELIRYRKEANEIRKLGAPGLWGDPLRDVLKDNVQFNRFIEAVDAGKLGRALSIQNGAIPVEQPKKKVFKAF